MRDGRGLYLVYPFFKNRIAAKALALGAFKGESMGWVRYLRIIEGNPEGDAIWGGLKRAG